MQPLYAFEVGVPLCGAPNCCEQKLVSACSTSSPLARHDLSAEALKLHVFAVLTTIYEGHPGVVRRRYLEGIADDLTDPVRELCAAGLWGSRPDRYVVPEAEVRRIAQIVQAEHEYGRGQRFRVT